MGWPYDGEGGGRGVGFEIMVGIVVALLKKLQNYFRGKKVIGEKISSKV